MKAFRLTNELSLYSLAFLLALFLRLFQLGNAPLGEVEAGWALQALGLAHGQSASLGAQPAYIILTSQLFSVFGDTNFLARLFPALAGSLLVWLPHLFRRWLDGSGWLPRAGVVMAFGLAVDPGLVSLSRQVGSPIPALAFTLLALACLAGRRMVWTGIFGGLALLSGPAFLQGALILGISWLLYRLVRRNIPSLQPEAEMGEVQPGPTVSRSAAAALAAFGGTLLVAGTLFLRFPGGLSALSATLPAYLDTWVAASGIPLLRLPASLLVYQPLVLIFGIITVGRTLFGEWDDPQVRSGLQGLGIWAGVALLLSLLYAGRQVGDMAWVLVPLWALAAAELSRSLPPTRDRTGNLIAASLGLLLFVLAVVGWFNLLAIGRFQVSVVIYWAIIIGALLLGIIAALLVAASWSSSAARSGVVWAVCTLLGLQLFSNTWGMAVVRQNGIQDLWPAPAATGQAVELTQTLTDLSVWNTGLKNQVEIVALVDSPALHWTLRHFPNTRFASMLSPTEAPPVVITMKDVQLPSLAEKYRGQDFIWRVYPGWQGVFPPNFINWLAFRQALLAQEQVILWARTDIFPGGASSSTESAVP